MDALPTTATRRKVITTIFPVVGLHDADSLPSVALRVNGTANATEPDVEKLDTGTYEYTYDLADTDAVNGNVISELVTAGYDGVEYVETFGVIVDETPRNILKVVQAQRRG